MARLYEMHFMSAAEKGYTSKELTEKFEQTMLDLGMVPEMALIKSNDGHNDNFIWIRGERYPMGVVVGGYEAAKKGYEVLIADQADRRRGEGPWLSDTIQALEKILGGDAEAVYGERLRIDTAIDVLSHVDDSTDLLLLAARTLALLKGDPNWEAVEL